MFNNEYKRLVKKVLEDGQPVKGRNGYTIAIPHYSFTIENMEYDHKLLLRKMYYKGVKGEFITIIDEKPLGNVKQFEKNGCNYWAAFADEYKSLRLDYHDEMVKQLPYIIEQIKTDPYSRRHVTSLWNHENVKNKVLSLECCWHNLTFSVIGDTLHLTWTQRSVDTMVGLPSDVYLAYLFMKHVAECTGYKIGSCMFALSNVHIYDEHIYAAQELLKRTTNDYDKPLEGLVLKL